MTLPNRTVIVSPISSWIKKDSQGNAKLDEHGDVIHKELQQFHLGLRQEKYETLLSQDSYIKLDQIFTLTRDAIRGKIVGKLTDDDLFQVDLRLMIVLQMSETLRKIMENNLAGQPKRIE